jgi:hypothetical protein
MMRLTPNKIVGVKLPDAPRINKGNTSIIYETADPNVLECYTVEQMKLEWWQRGLDITLDYYTEEGEAHYYGFGLPNRYSTRLEWKHVTLPVYRCLVRRLDPLTDEQLRRSKQIRRAIRNLLIPMRMVDNVPVQMRRWDAIYKLSEEYPELREPVEFVHDYDCQHIWDDFGNGDWLSMDGRMVCIDPFHHDDVNEALSLRQQPECY